MSCLLPCFCTWSDTVQHLRPELATCAWLYSPQVLMQLDLVQQLVRQPCLNQLPMTCIQYYQQG
jgi:hypothetical protein